jgi:hypothetical protein
LHQCGELARWSNASQPRADLSGSNTAADSSVVPHLFPVAALGSQCEALHAGAPEWTEMSTMVRPECQHFLDEIQEKRDDLIALQQELQTAPTNFKPGIKKRIAECQAQIDALEKSFSECEGVQPLPAPIAAVFPSTVFIGTSNAAFPTLGPASATATMTFSQADYNSVLFTFPATLVGTFTVTFLGFGVFTNAVTASLSPSSAGGSFERSTGHVDIAQANFYIDNSQWFIADSTLQFTPLTTRSVPSPLSGTLIGAPLNRTTNPGRLVLVGSSTLTGGYYSGTVVDILIDGVLSQFPPP